MRIAIGADHGGYNLKEKLIPFLVKKGHKLKDFGTYTKVPCDYPLVGYRVANAVSSKRFKRGILICKTGIGDAIAANKVKGIRAAVCYNVTLAKTSRKHNDTNVLVLAASFTKLTAAKRIVNTWLATKAEGGRHARRVRQICKIEKGILR